MPPLASRRPVLQDVSADDSEGLVTDALIRLTAFSTVQFGTAAQLPDGDGSLVLTAVAMVVLQAVRRLLTA